MNFMKWRMLMTKTIKINKNTEQGLIELFKSLLEKNKIAGVFTLKKINKNGDIAYSLITDSDKLKDAVPFYPLMPVNAGKLLSRFTLRGAAKEPILAVLKPCELRAFIELVKREQGTLDNMYFLSSTCGGVYPLQMAVDKNIEKNIPKYWDALKKEEIPENLRPACKACTEFEPYTADITIDLLTNKNIDKESYLYINNKKGEELIKDVKKDFLQKEIDGKKIEKIRNKKQTEKQKLYQDIDKKMNGLDGLIDIFGRCIGCHGCSKVCPICYCKLCEFESSDSEYEPSNYESELRRRGGLKVPPGTLYYQLGRLTHIGISCVGCGQCEDVCPVDIPLSIIFKKVGESIQEMFKYTPGKNVEEEVPLVTFKQEELSEIEE
jgi:formate dehydrogenase subunit beta